MEEAVEKALESLKEDWDKWDLRILVLYSLTVQICLIFLGRYRKTRDILTVNILVWFFYLLAELWATIALGKISDVHDDCFDEVKESLAPCKIPDVYKQYCNVPNVTVFISAVHKDCNITNFHISTDVLRTLWAPSLLFYLGGPDTITVLTLEENHMWLRHLIGLVIQGFRTSYALRLTWKVSWLSINGSWLSILTLVMIFTGMMKYGERVWAIWSRSHGMPEVSIQSQHFNNNIRDANLILQAYSYYQTLKPHINGHLCDSSSLEDLKKKFKEQVKQEVLEDSIENNAFKTIEIELGFMYDMLFSKVGMAFTLFGCIVRPIRFSCLVFVLVVFLLIEKKIEKGLPDDFKVDTCITSVLVFGALFIEISDAIVQLLSDWAMLWALRHQKNWLATPIFSLHHLFLMHKIKRWSNHMGQFNLIDFCTTPKSGVSMVTKYFNKLTRWRMDEKFLNVPVGLKGLIIRQLVERTQNASDLRPLAQNRGDWTTLKKFDLGREFEWRTVEVDFDESIIIWHIATGVFYYSGECPEDNRSEEEKMAKMLSDYMLYLLVQCHSKFPICLDNMFTQAYADVNKHIFEEKEPLPDRTEACRLFLKQTHDSGSVTVERVHKLACRLVEEDDKWKIMSNVWVEMLCYAACQCPGRNHAQSIRHGGELLSHVWLLLMHFGVIYKVKKSISKDVRETAEFGLKGVTECLTACINSEMSIL